MIDCLPDIVTEHPSDDGTAHTAHRIRLMGDGVGQPEEEQVEPWVSSML